MPRDVRREGLPFLTILSRSTVEAACRVFGHQWRECVYLGVPIATEKKMTIFKSSYVQFSRRAASRADCTAGNSRPIRVKPVRC